MKIQNITNSFSLPSSREKIYISKETFNKAKEIASKGDIALIYGSNVVKLHKDTLNDLISNFKGDIKTFDGIYIATNKAKEYMEKITDFVMNDLDVASADANKDGVLTPQEKINAKSMLYDNKIVKPKDVLSTNELINFISHQKSETIDDIIDENIRFDKNKDGKVSALEVKKGLSIKAKHINVHSNTDSLISKLKAKLKKIRKEILQLKTNEKENADKIKMLQMEEMKIMIQLMKLEAPV